MASSQQIRAYFKKVDPKLAALMPKGFNYVLKEDRDSFEGLCSIIIGQQLSVKAAASIRARFVSLFPKKNVSPLKLAKMDHDVLRSVGLSNAKAKALKELGDRVAKKEFVIEKLNHMSDREAVASLVTLRGIGPWSADMFLIFHLGHEDIFALGDLGLQRAVQKIYGLKKTVPLSKIEKISEKWKPYRSYASLLLWNHLDTKPK